MELAAGSSFTTSRKSSGERDALAHQAEQSWSGERELQPAQTALDNILVGTELMGSMDAPAIRRAYESSAGPAKVTGGGMPPHPTPPKVETDE